MSTFADFLLEFGEKRVEHPAHRAGAWVTALTGQNWRFRISRPGKAGTLHEIPARNWSAWVTGEIYSYADVPGDTIECATRFLEEVSSSRARPESLSGRFLLMGWSADSQTWNIWTDRCGGVHAYLTGLEGNAAVGTYTAAVYEYSRRKLDWTGLAGFFALGFFPQDRTYYEDCRVLRPGSHYEFSPVPSTGAGPISRISDAAKPIRSPSLAKRSLALPVYKAIMVAWFCRFREGSTPGR
jgi:hypothetical protein